MLSRQELKKLASEEIRERNAAASEHNAKDQIASSETTQKKWTPRSRMLSFGTYGTLISVGLILWFVSPYPTDNLGIIFGLGGLAGTCILMWMLGTIEQRLIEINQTLKAK